MPRFRDNGGHEFEITKEQAAGKVPIVCPTCAWQGTPIDEGAEVLEEPKKLKFGLPEEKS